MSECITTPASCEPRPTVAIFGAGIAGLTAAQELAERGFVVTVYEPRADERNGLGSEPAGRYPPVKLGGLAASQYSTVGPRGGSQAELRPFPGRRGQPRDPQCAVAGEHGFRFFPAYYLHIWDMFQRIPVYQLTPTVSGTNCWAPTSRTVYDNVRRVVTQGVTVDGKPSLVFPRELPRSPAEFLGVLGQLARMGFTPSDVATFAEQAAALPRHQSAASRTGNCRTCPPTTSSSVTTARPEPTGSLTRRISTRSCAKCQGSWRRSTRAGGMRAPTSPPICSCT